MRKIWRALGWGAVAGLGGLAGFSALAPVLLGNLGATPDERTRPLPGGATRLLVRSCLTYPDTLGQWLLWHAVTEPLHVVMQERMLRGIRDRAARGPAAQPRRAA